MDMNDMVMVSIDDHVIEPPDLFEHHWPSTRRDEAPRLERRDDGVDVWVFQGAEMGNVGLNAVASWPHEEWGFDAIGHAEMRPGCYDMDLRVRDMDANGVLASMMFPTFAGFNGVRFAEPAIPDKDLATMAIAAYNDWQIDELAGEHPGRFIPLAIGPVYDSAKLATEIRRVAAKGCTAISLPETPYGVGLPGFDDRDYWDPVFAACCDEDVVLCLHIGGSFGLIKLPPGMLIDHLIVLAPQLSAITMADLLLAGALARFPTLKVALSEGGIGWIPFFLDRLDRHMWNHEWTGLQIGPPGVTPSELYRSNFLGCFITDPSALHLRDRIGIDTIAWECDYPHSDSTWPRSPETLWGELHGAGCTAEEIDKITWENACRFFRFDPFVQRTREQAGVGALRAGATDVDVRETSRAEYRRRWTQEHATA
jgi:predicted TIM-barrel fold metal-dependent hydrolase